MRYQSLQIHFMRSAYEIYKNQFISPCPLHYKHKKFERQDNANEIFQESDHSLPISRFIHLNPTDFKLILNNSSNNCFHEGKVMFQHQTNFSNRFIENTCYPKTIL